MKAREIFDWLDHRAPFETQLDYDNSGWIVGDPEMQVSGIHLALDCTPQVLQQPLFLIFTFRKMPLDRVFPGRIPPA